MDKHIVLDQLVKELQRFLLTLEKETLSGNATVQKGLLSDLLQSYKASNAGDEEYIYMNKVSVPFKDKEDKDEWPDALSNGTPRKHVPAPQKSLPVLPPPRTGVVGREPFPLPVVPAPACLEPQEGYYEEAQPYEETAHDDGEAVSSSYESYDEEEVTKGKSSLSAQHQWPSSEASIELMKDARICAFLWRKKWLGQWAKQLCVIREDRLLCYKSSKEQTPLLDVSLLGSSVVYKEKQLKRKEHKLKIVPLGGEAIVLGLQSKEQTEQWLKVIQEISPKPMECTENQMSISDLPSLICTKGELGERYSMASESGSSTDSHAETPESKDVKKKYGAGLKFSNLMNIGKKKTSSSDINEKCVDTSGYLNVLVNSQWRPRWCRIKNGQLWFYQDKAKTKAAQQPVPLEGCMVVPDPSPEHLYSFRIHMDGNQLATLEAKSSDDMGHWLGLLLSQMGTKMEPEDLTYDYVNSERISSIVNAAKTSLYLMQRRFSEPNTYIDSLPCIPRGADDLYDDVPSIEADLEDAEERDLLDGGENRGPDGTEPRNGDDVAMVVTGQDTVDQIYLDLIPVRSFLHTSGGGGGLIHKDCFRPTMVECPDSPGQLQKTQSHESPGSPAPQSSSSPAAQRPKAPQSPPGLGLHGLSPSSHSPQPCRGRSASSGGDKVKVLSTGCEGRLGKNRTEADLRRYMDERHRLEREREEVRSRLASMNKERRETREELSACQDPGQQNALEARLKRKEEACREVEERRVEVELRLMEVKESLRKVEAGPFSLGTTLDSSLQEGPLSKAAPVAQPQTPPSQPSLSTNSGDSMSPSPVNSATVLKNRPTSIMAASKVNVMQKAKEWEKKSST
ncbi:actin filament-associated protein 1-like 2 [Aplochiton taeniatus]